MAAVLSGFSSTDPSQPLPSVTGSLLEIWTFRPNIPAHAASLARVTVAVNHCRCEHSQRNKSVTAEDRAWLLTVLRLDGFSSLELTEYSHSLCVLYLGFADSLCFTFKGLQLFFSVRFLPPAQPECSWRERRFCFTFKQCRVQIKPKLSELTDQLSRQNKKIWNCAFVQTTITLHLYVFYVLYQHFNNTCHTIPGETVQVGVSVSVGVLNHWKPLM